MTDVELPLEIYDAILNQIPMGLDLLELKKVNKTFHNIIQKRILRQITLLRVVYQNTKTSNNFETFETLLINCPKNYVIRQFSINGGKHKRRLDKYNQHLKILEIQMDSKTFTIHTKSVIFQQFIKLYPNSKSLVNNLEIIYSSCNDDRLIRLMESVLSCL